MYGETGGLASRYRPKKIEDLFGQESVKTKLNSILSKDPDKMPRCFFLSGPKGCGKTTTALIIANIIRVNSDFDLHYLDSAAYGGVDSIRQLRAKVPYSPIGGKYKLYIFDECHRMSPNAQDALLTLLENPPKHSFFALCTTEPEKMIETVRSRCVSLQFSNLSSMDVNKIIKHIQQSEGVEEVSPKVRQAVVKASEGSARNVLMILESILGKSEEEALSHIPSIAMEDSDLREILRLLIKSDAKNRWAMIREDVSALDGEPETIRKKVLGYLNKALLATDNPDKILRLMAPFTESTYNTGKAGLNIQFCLAAQV